MDAEAHVMRLPGLERHPGEPDELTVGAGDGGDVVAHVELDHLITESITGVGHRERHDHDIGRRSRLDLELAVVERL